MQNPAHPTRHVHFANQPQFFPRQARHVNFAQAAEVFEAEPAEAIFDPKAAG